MISKKKKKKKKKFEKKKINKIKQNALSHLSVIMQLMVLVCVTWVIAFTGTFGDYFDMMIL